MIYTHTYIHIYIKENFKLDYCFEKRKSEQGGQGRTLSEETSSSETCMTRRCQPWKAEEECPAYTFKILFPISNLKPLEHYLDFAI